MAGEAYNERSCRREKSDSENNATDVQERCPGCRRQEKAKARADVRRHNEEAILHAVAADSLVPDDIRAATGPEPEAEEDRVDIDRVAADSLVRNGTTATPEPEPEAEEDPVVIDRVAEEALQSDPDCGNDSWKARWRRWRKR